MQKTFRNLIITRMTRGKLPRLPFLHMKNAILGEHYDLSLAFIGRKDAIALHKKWKSKNTPVNILSFPLSNQEGEMVISLEQARREAGNFGRTYEKYLAFLFIHGCVHLRGHAHGPAMDRLEEKYRKKFGV